ncbi:MAG: type II toxin-antitoxin system HicB family antitoxin [Acidaminococcaceae bacterium]|nr:type II toxin-antitoxin system HicB family antitoxin [Acidaminococcaceae bacterium]
MKYIYPALIIKEKDGFIVKFPDLDDVFTDGNTLEEAYKNAEDVLNLMLWDMEEDNSVIPKPSSIDDIKVPENSTVALVKADTLEYRKANDTKSVRKNVSIPSWLNTLATSKNINFSNLLQNALMHELGVDNK